jgi:glycosyltransferase involved in cell wall biosynthesis
MNQAPKDLCRAFVNQGVPFAITMQCASEAYWPTDEEVERAGYVYEHAKAIYFVSEANRLLTKKQFVKEPLHAEVVRNPFNVGYDTPFAWPAPSDVWKLAFVGRLEPQSKGCDILLDIMDSPKWRSRNVLISFYGEGYNARSLRSYAQLLKLTNVRFCGHVDNIEKVWMEHHMLLLPARHEGVPMVVVEAMLCGRACITTNVGACGEFIHDNVTGFLSEAATVTHFDQAMERAWSVREHWREIGERAGAAIRAAVPPDPVGIFAQKLIELASSTAGPVDLPP